MARGAERPSLPHESLHGRRRPSHGRLSQRPALPQPLAQPGHRRPPYDGERQDASSPERSRSATSRRTELVPTSMAARRSRDLRPAAAGVGAPQGAQRSNEGPRQHVSLAGTQPTGLVGQHRGHVRVEAGGLARVRGPTDTRRQHRPVVHPRGPAGLGRMAPASALPPASIPDRQGLERFGQIAARQFAQRPHPTGRLGGAHTGHRRGTGEVQQGGEGSAVFQIRTGLYHRGQTVRTEHGHRLQATRGPTELGGHDADGLGIESRLLASLQAPGELVQGLVPGDPHPRPLQGRLGLQGLPELGGHGDAVPGGTYRGHDAGVVRSRGVAEYRPGPRPPPSGWRRASPPVRRGAGCR